MRASDRMHAIVIAGCWSAPDEGPDLCIPSALHVDLTAAGGRLDGPEATGWRNADGISPRVSTTTPGSVVGGAAHLTFRGRGLVLLPLDEMTTALRDFPVDGGLELSMPDGLVLGSETWACDVDGDGGPDLCTGGANAAVYTGPVDSSTEPWSTYRHEDVLGSWTVADLGHGANAYLSSAGGVYEAPLSPGDHDLSNAQPVWPALGWLGQADVDDDGDADLVSRLYWFDDGHGLVSAILDDDRAALASEAFQLTGPMDSNFGASVDWGDYNGDGLVDMAVGAPGRSGERGRVYVLAGPLSASTSVEDAEVWEVDCQTAARFGYSLATIPMPGRDALLVGAPDCVIDRVASGAVFLLEDPLRIR